MGARPTEALDTYARLRAALIAAVVLAIVGWVGLWFRSDKRWIAFVVWGIGNGVAVILAIALALLRCPTCNRRGLKSKGCPYCGFEKG